MVQEAVDRIMRNRTTVIVADRLATVRNTDMIAVIQRGCIVEKGSHSQLIMNPSGPFSQFIRLHETHPSKEQYANDPKHMEMHLRDSRTVGRLISRKSSLRRYISSRSSGIGGSCNSVSFPFSLPDGVGLQENVQVGKSKPKKGFMNWFSSKNQGDVEDGQLKHGKNIVSHLASLNKAETLVFILGIHCSSCSWGYISYF